MMDELAAWSSRCDSVLGELETEIAKVKADAVKRRKEDLRAEKQVKAVTEVGDKSTTNILGLSRGGHNTRGATRKDQDDDEDDAMDVDGGFGMGGKKRSGGGGGGGAFGGLMGRLGGRTGGR